MAKRTGRKKRPTGPAALTTLTYTAGSLEAQMLAYLQWMAERNFSAATITNRRTYVGGFVRWCDERGLSTPAEVTRPVLERYQRHLYLLRKADGQPLSIRNQSGRLVALRCWFRWLSRGRQILSNPAADLDMPRQEYRLPAAILSAEEAERILAMPDLATPTGLRDRTILEILYSTGIRRLELLGLNCMDIDHGRGTLMVRQGKGKRDRVVPIGDRALAWVTRYCDEVRPGWRLADDEGALFLTPLGERMGDSRLTQAVGGYVRASGVNKPGSCHLFRHTCATLMLEGGADIRYIQAMLGHVLLDSTMLYTRVSIRLLKDIHTATHPARLERQSSEAEALLADLAAEAEDG